MPKVSVVMPVYNGERYIAQAVETVLAQTHQEHELIVVDDGSTDATPAIIARFGSQVSYHRQANRGPSVARNAGLRLASGEFVTFLDADDEWDPRFLARCVETLVAQPDAVAVCTGWMHTDPEGRPLPHTLVQPPARLSLADLMVVNPVQVDAVVLRREVLLAMGGFDETIRAMEDWDLWLRLVVDGHRFVGIPDCLVYYRLHGYTNSRHADRMQAGRLAALAKLFDRPNLPPEYQELRLWAYGRAQVQNSVEAYASGRPDDGLRLFCQAVQTYLPLLDDTDAWFGLLCAEQPVGYKATASYLDVTAAESRARDVLAACADLPDAEVGRWLPRGRGRAFATLTRLAYQQGLTAEARRYAHLAVQAAPSLVRDRPWASTALRALLGKRAVMRLKSWTARS